MEKKLAQTIEQVQQEHPSATVEVWAEDEHRIGLHPVNRLMWVPIGEQPIACVNWKYQWLWLVGLVEPTTGNTDWWILPLLNHEVFTRVLEDFARHFQLGEQKRVILVLDQAAFHTSDKLRVPEGIPLLFLPAQSPELQPAERLWPLTNEAIANRSFANLDELEIATAHRCRVLLKRRDLIKGLTSFHWWAAAVG